MRGYINILGVTLFIFCFGCNQEISSTLYVSEDFNGLFVQTKDGWDQIKPGEYKMKLSFNDSGRRPSSASVYDLTTGKKVSDFKLNLPPAKEVLTALEEVELSASELGQAFNIKIERQVDYMEDHYGVTFLSLRSNKILASTTFNYKPKEANFDEETQSYLRSYQNVKKSHRAVFIAIDANLDDFFYAMPAIGEVSDAIVNYTGALLLFPWAHFRYKEVKWLIGDNTDDSEKITEAWTKVIDKSPVVDFMAFVHGGHEEDIVSHLDEIPHKENQLRYAYTSGCESGNGDFFIVDHNASIAVGHEGLSASPLFSFSLFRNWTYGRSLQTSLSHSYKSGSAKARALNAIASNIIKKYWVDVDDMIASSEPRSAYLRSLPPSQVFVNLSSIPSKLDRDSKSVFTLAAESADRDLLEGIPESTMFASNMH